MPSKVGHIHVTLYRLRINSVSNVLFVKLLLPSKNRDSSKWMINCQRSY